GEAMDLSVLAQVWSRLGDPVQGLAIARQTLALYNRLDDIEARADAHHNLASHLHRVQLVEEADEHRLAALIYRAVLRLNPHHSLAPIFGRIGDSIAHGERFTFLPIADLLARPTFTALRGFLAERGESLDGLQAGVNQFIAEAHTLVANSLSSSDLPPPAQ